ncbi:hypothetical protein [Microbacterium deminutum]|uniref:Lipoprotein n=1 Tax=Microbacterium deminutum TaxID=344164 RepID=A0ABN2QI41_9MICO
MTPKSTPKSAPRALELRALCAAAALALVLTLVVGCEASTERGRSQNAPNTGTGAVCTVTITDHIGRKMPRRAAPLVGRWRPAPDVDWYLEVSLNGRFSLEADQRVVDAGTVTVAGDILTLSSYQGGGPTDHRWSTVAGPVRKLYLDDSPWIAVPSCPTVR